MSVSLENSCTRVFLESLPRTDEDTTYQATLSELAKKRLHEHSDVPVEPGIFRIEEPPLCVADPSRYVSIVLIDCITFEREVGGKVVKKKRHNSGGSDFY